MQFEKYEGYHVVDFIEDEDFCRYVRHPELVTNAQWKRFLNRYPHKAEIIAEARKIVEGLEDHFQGEVASISEERVRRSFQSLALDEDKSAVQTQSRTIWVALAASVFILIGISLFLYDADPATLTYATRNGQLMNIVLPDSSTIQLNANSSVSFSQDRWAENGVREVELIGEAFFDIVESAESSAFIVHTDEIDILVTGTQFNVRARGEESQIILTEGQIELSIADQKIAMHPGDLISYTKSEGVVESKKVTPNNYVAWKDGMAVFNDTLLEVAKELEIVYGVKFTIQNEKLKERIIRLSAPADSLAQVLQILEIMYPGEITIEKTDGEIIIK